MRIGFAMGLAAAACALACNHVRAGEPAWQRVNVRMSTALGALVPASLLWDSQATATRIFARIGVELTWRSSHQRKTSKQAESCREESAARELGVEIVPHAPRNLSGFALAMAIPSADSGVSMTVFYDRVNPLLQQHRAPQAIVLGYVLAHEIAHVLQGIARHSEMGIMRARWTANDFGQMAIGALAFTTEDVALMRRGPAPLVASASCPETQNAKP